MLGRRGFLAVGETDSEHLGTLWHKLCAVSLWGLLTQEYITVC